MRPILMSIRDGHADNIMAGTKVVEFRKGPIATGTTVIVYRSGDSEKRGIVGMFVVGEAHRATSSQHLARYTNREAGLPLHRLTTYAGGPDAFIWAMSVTEVEPFWKSIRLSEVGISNPPQSWMFAPDSMVQMLREMAEVPF